MKPAPLHSPPAAPGILQRWAKLYLIGLFAWFLLYLVIGDGFRYLGLLNTVAIYLFAPLPIVTILAIGWRKLPVVGASLLGVGVFAFLWGPLFLPVTTATAGPTLRVMTFNVLGRVGDPMHAVASIQHEDPDVIFLQEVTGEYATIFRQTLKQDFPYQIIDPGTRSSGMAVFSSLPIERAEVVLTGDWRGDPQVLFLEWRGQQITLVNFHTISTGAIWPRWVRYTFAQREESMAELAQFAADAIRLGPVIVAGDANLTRLNDGYQTLDAVLDDAWWEAGTGLGHTFPAQIEPDDWLTRVSFFFIPHWLARIDYIFYSDHWQPSRTWLAEFYGGSDHRGVVTDLILVSD